MVLVSVCCCCADGIREKDKNMLGGVLKMVAVLNKDNSYSLAKHAWQDVRSDWPYYTDVDKQLLKKSVQPVLLFPSPAFSASPQCWFVSTLICSPEREARDVSSCLESQGCHLIPLSYLLSCFFFCLVLLRLLSCHFCANGPFSWPFLQKTLKYFSLRVRPFCMALVEQIGDDSW